MGEPLVYLRDSNQFRVEHMIRFIKRKHVQKWHGCVDTHGLSRGVTNYLSLRQASCRGVATSHKLLESLEIHTFFERSQEIVLLIAFRLKDLKDPSMSLNKKK